MEFDKSRVYTALNADELKVGSKCIFADTIHALREKVGSDSAQRSVYVLRAVRDGCERERFEEDDSITYLLAYLIEPPAEPKYKPFGSVKKAMEVIKQHGGWVKDKKSDSQYLLIEIGGNAVYLGDGYARGFNDMFSDFVFADDGSPCGELVVE